MNCRDTHPRRGGHLPGVLLAIVTLLLPGCGVVGSAAGGAASSQAVKVGVVTSTSGPLGSYGTQYVEGFRAGLSYATKGTGAIRGRPVEVVYQDDTGDPAKATSIVTDLLGKGHTIIAGTAVSGVALQLAPLAEQNRALYVSGPAATDSLTGFNRNTFRSGRQTWQDVMAAARFLPQLQGKKVVVFAPDSAFGQANVAAVRTVLGGQGAIVEAVLAPAGTTDFTPFAVRAKEARPDLLFVAWAGDNASSMWQSLDQQGLFASTAVATGLDQRSSYPTFGPVAERIQFLSHYVAEAADNEPNRFLRDSLGRTPDLFHPDGFVAAQMVVHALEQADTTDVEAMIRALEGWTFEAPKGPQTVRPEDHAMLQPMFQARLVASPSGLVPRVVETFPPDAVAPPPKPFGPSR